MKNMNSNLLFVQTENKLKFFPYMLQKQNNDVLCIPILKQLIIIIIKAIFFHKAFKQTENKHYV